MAEHCPSLDPERRAQLIEVVDRPHDRVRPGSGRPSAAALVVPHDGVAVSEQSRHRTEVAPEPWTAGTGHHGRPGPVDRRPQRRAVVQHDPPRRPALLGQHGPPRLRGTTAPGLALAGHPSHRAVTRAWSVALQLTRDVELITLRISHQRPRVPVLVMVGHPCGAQPDETGDLGLDVDRDNV